MGILGGIMGRREPVTEYRTVDGGHPAPYPEMTDEQLYNYELTFNVGRRTFSRPPARPAEPAQAARPEAQLREDGARLQDAPRLQDVPRLRRNKAFDAPRYTARRALPSNDPVHSLPALDFSKPVRLVTNKQAVDIITTRARHPVYKVHGYIGDDDVVTVFTLDGRLSPDGPRFLENAPQPQQLHLNIYMNETCSNGERYRITQHDTRAEADGAAETGRLICVAVQLRPGTLGQSPAS